MSAFLIDLSLTLLIVLVLVAVNGFFVASEFALVSVRRTRVDELVAQGLSPARAVKGALADLDRYIAGTQIGITIASLALGWLGEPLVARLITPLFHQLPFSVAPALIHTVAYLISFVFITFAHVVLGELVPKSVALQRSEQVALSVGRPMSIIVIFFRPLIAALNGTGNLFLRFAGFAPAGEYHNVHSVDELDILVRQSHQAGVLDDLESEILERTFHFSELSAGEIKTPRADIDALDLKKPVSELLQQLASTYHTRLPVYEESIDRIIGMVHVHDVFRAMRRDGVITDLRQIVRPAFLVPEGIHLDDLVEQFRANKTKVAVVIDEHGATAGIVTFKDIIEEIFGSLRSTPDREGELIEQLPDGRLIARGDTRLDELRREIGWELEDEDVATVAGLIMKHLGRVAQPGDAIEVPEGTISVARMNKLRITQVVLQPAPAPVREAEQED